MGNYNDFDLDIKKVQGENDIGPASITTTIILSIKTCTEALSCDGGRRPGEPRSCRGIDPCGVVHKIGGKGRITLNLLIRQISGQLVYDGCHHFQMPQLLCADVRQQALNLWIGHGVALGEIPQGGAQLPVRTT